MHGCGSLRFLSLFFTPFSRLLVLTWMAGWGHGMAFGMMMVRALLGLVSLMSCI
jgi:hypothetical protein